MNSKIVTATGRKNVCKSSRHEGLLHKRSLSVSVEMNYFVVPVLQCTVDIQICLVVLSCASAHMASHRLHPAIPARLDTLSCSMPLSTGL
jgi:hypothetical protein